MKLERRLKRLEIALKNERQKRLDLVTEVLVLRAAFIGMASINEDASAAQHGAAKDRAMERLSNYLMVAEYPSAEAEEALGLLEDTFYELDVARSAVDQTPPIPS